MGSKEKQLYGEFAFYLGTWKEKEVWVQSLDKSVRYFGRKEMWYDGPINTLGCWFFEFVWHFPF